MGEASSVIVSEDLITLFATTPLSCLATLAEPALT